MSSRAPIRQLALGVLTCTSVALLSPSLLAAGERVECVAAADRGQIDRQAGHLRSARDSFVRCSAEACPAIVRNDCQHWAVEVEAALPTIVFFATDAQGNDVADVRVRLDDHVLVDHLDGRSMPVDPGLHDLVFERNGSPAVHQNAVFVQGEHDRKIAVRFVAPSIPGASATAVPSSVVAAPTTTPPPKGADGASLTRKNTHHVPMTSVVLAGVGVVAIGSFAFFGISGKNDLAAIDASRCAPDCSAHDIDAVRSKLIIADTSLVVGVVALGVATYLWLTASPSPTVAAASRARVPGLRF